MLSVLIRFRGEKKKRKSRKKISAHESKEQQGGEGGSTHSIYIYKRGVENPRLSTLSEGTTQTGGKRAERGEGDM
jgi:hypothetical protein